MGKIQKSKEQVKTKKPKVYISFNTRLLTLTLLFIALVICSTLSITKSINTNKTVQINYKGDEELNYKVYLKENDFYETNYLEENMAYITSLIDNIKVNYKDTFSIDKKVDLNYHYKIVARLVITPKNNIKQILFEKSYILLDKSGNVENKNSYGLNEEIEIDYNKYNQVANNFKTTYGIDCESKLYVSKVLLTTGNETNYDININNISENSLEIPLSEKQITITKNIKVSEKKSDTTTLKAFIDDKVLFILGVVLSIVVVIDAIFIIKLVSLLKPKKDKYEKELKRILNEYDRMIVSVNRMPDLSKHDVYKVTSFDELIDARDNLKIPIAYVKISKEKSCFYVKDENIIYIYYLKSIDL